nr:MAG TPA: head to tail connecting protein [Caudoviricetes sp.]
MTDDLKRRCLERWEALKSERTSWMTHWQEISEVLTPRTGRFLVSDNNKGDKRHRAILDNTGTRALRTLAGGMMAGMTSPARPWFRLTTLNPELDESYEVKDWLGRVTSLMQMVFAKSNIYQSLTMAYEELGAYGTAAVILYDDPDNVIHCMPLTIGEYAIATDGRGRVNTLYREFRMTVAQLVQEFGYASCSGATQQMFDKRQYDEWVTVVNAIEPRDMRDPEKIDNKNMPYRSVYFEDCAEDKKILRESGFRTFPCLCGRWGVSGGDIYGTSPGMEALGDLHQLQQEQLRKSQAIDYQSNPPVLVPADLKDDESAIVPGGTVFVDSVSQAQMVRSAYDVPLRLDFLLQDIQDVRARINEAFYKDIFMMLTEQGGDRMTATEVAERHEEKMLMLGPVLDRLNSEMLDPLITLVFERLQANGMLPPLPEELQGVELNVDFISILAQSQKAVTTNAIDRFVSSLNAVAGMKQEVLDKFNADRWADTYADSLGIDAQLIVPDKEVAKLREARAQAQAQQAQLEQAQQAASTMKDVAQAQIDPMQPQDINNLFAGY